jgi:hypothetical protein
MKHLLLMSFFALTNLIGMQNNDYPINREYPIIGHYYAEIGKPYRIVPEALNEFTYPLYIKRKDRGDAILNWFNCPKLIESVAWNEDVYPGLDVVFHDGTKHFIPWNILK